MDALAFSAERVMGGKKGIFIEKKKNIFKGLYAQKKSNNFVE